MLIDILFIAIVITAIFKGYSKGLIMAVFSAVSIFVGLIAATKLSAVVANYLHANAHINWYWLPVISFALVMFAVVLLIILGGKFVQKTFEVALLGWANRLGGIVLFFCIYITVLSVILFFAEKINFISEDTVKNSKTYFFIQPWGPLAINAIGYIIPIFKGLFEQLSHFFEKVAAKNS